MTELERLLKKAVNEQRATFKEELHRVTRSYERNLNDVILKFQNIVSAQKSTIDEQGQTLNRYDKLSTNLQISIDDQQVQSLKQTHQILLKKLTLLEESFKSLEDGLKELTNQYKELQMR